MKAIKRLSIIIINKTPIQIRIIKKYLMSLNTAINISIIKAKPEKALKYVAILIQQKIIASAPNILTEKSLLN